MMHSRARMLMAGPHGVYWLYVVSYRSRAAKVVIAGKRTAHAEAVIADRRLQLTMENADLVQRLAGITEARVRAGEISELEGRSARSDAARDQVLRRAVEHDGAHGCDGPEPSVLHQVCCAAQRLPGSGAVTMPSSSGAKRGSQHDSVAVRAKGIARVDAGAFRHQDDPALFEHHGRAPAESADRRL
jgi:hypothetical protein